MHSVLNAIDDEGNSGNGMMELDELTEAFTVYAVLKAAAKEGGGSIAILTQPWELQSTLKVFDVDGDSTVANIIYPYPLFRYRSKIK